MNTPVRPNYAAIAQRVIRLSNIHRKTELPGSSTVRIKNFARGDSRYYSVTALIATAIDPKKAGAVTKKLLPALDAFYAEKLLGLPSVEVDACREMFVERFLRFEYGGVHAGSEQLV